jgi:Peptidase family M23
MSLYAFCISVPKQEQILRKIGHACLVLAGLAGAVLALGNAHAQGCGRPLPAEAGTPPIRITPVTLRILQRSVMPVPATDGLLHLAYAALMTNVSHDTARLTEITPTDAQHAPTGNSEVRDMNGKDITATVLPFKPDVVDGVVPSKSVNTRQLQGGASGISFFDVRYTKIEDVPRLLSHRLSIVFPGKDQPVTEDTDPIEVDCRTPVVISPPLVGSRWWDANGCCTVISPHRGATLPVNGDFKLPEQFAIDYVQLNARGGCCTGPVKELGSWPFFGAPILAVADGVVAGRVDGMPEQVPGEVTGIDAQNAAGNHIVEDIGGGHFVLYAHMRTDSIPGGITVGTKLTRGRQIGEVGNTGSSTAPHLHFQVMDRPSVLDATGLPFVFDRQILEGRVTGTANQTNDAYEAGGTLTVEANIPTTQVNRMPVEGQVFGYNPK